MIKLMTLLMSRAKITGVDVNKFLKIAGTNLSQVPLVTA
jgi:hypothetical protein